MSEPTTDAGRALLAVYAHDPQFLADILAIEREARAQGALHEGLAGDADIDRAVTRVLDALADDVQGLPAYGAPAATHGSPEADAYWRPSVSLAAVLALIEQHRPKGGPG